MDRKFDYIDALRGIAILMVMTVHAGQYVPEFEPLTRWGARGVQLFFVASAFTLAMSWDHRHDGVWPFYIRRFFRIAPVFWAGMAFYLWMRGGSGSAGSVIAPWHVGVTTVFLHGLFPQTINLVVPGGWSIADEMMFYAIFPLLILAMKKLRWSLVILIVTTVASSAWLIVGTQMADRLFTVDNPAEFSNFMFLSLPAQATAFVAGIIAYKLNAKLNHAGFVLPQVVSNGMLFVAILSVVLFAAIALHFLPAYGLAFAMVIFAMSQGAGRFVPNRLLNQFGKISFSMYLAHFYLLGHAYRILATWDLSPTSMFAGLWISTALASLLLCSLIYLVIETPTMEMGRKLAARFRQTPRAVVLKS